jgi:hypothetical protein
VSAKLSWLPAANKLEKSESLRDRLEGVELESFTGSSHDLDLLKLLFRCVTLTKVTVKLASNVCRK